MAIINKVDFDVVIKDALNAAKNVLATDWDKARDIVENLAKGIVNDVLFIEKKKLSGEFNEKDAQTFMEDQKMLARIRLRSLAIITLQIAEDIWNAIARVFRAAIKTAVGWVVL
jgi:hypothetical protein